MPSPTQLRGGRAEQRAVFYLRRNGFAIMEQHLTSRFGEIDILAMKDSSIYIVEVKYRTKERAWPIELTITTGKMRRLVLTFEAWVQEHPEYRDARLRMLWLFLTPSTIRLVEMKG
jgi:putative endonuclease